MPRDAAAAVRRDGPADRRTAGSEGVRSDGSYFDPEFQAFVVPVVLGHHRMSSRLDDMLVTTLGSCVAVCLHDPAARVGGMNHFLLPGRPDGDAPGIATRYGAEAMERLVADLLSRGAAVERLEAKIFGGARVIETSYDVGAANTAFAQEWLAEHGLRVCGRDVGGAAGRRVHFFPTSGRAFRRFLRPDLEQDTISREIGVLRGLDRVRRSPPSAA